MKVKQKESPFIPITYEVTFDSQEEHDKFFSALLYAGQIDKTFEDTFHGLMSELKRNGAKQKK